jgi:hypothetical protein
VPPDGDVRNRQKQKYYAAHDACAEENGDAHRQINGAITQRIERFVSFDKIE